MELSITALASILLVPSLLLLIRISFRSKKACRNLPPGTLGWPLLGEIIEYRRANSKGCPDKFVRDRVKRYGSMVFRTSLFGQPVVFLCGPAGNKFMFSNEGRKVGHWAPAPVRRLTGRSLTSMIGTEARVRKKLMMAGFFNTELLKKRVPAMDEITRSCLKTHWQGKEEVQVRSFAKLYTFEVACRLLMSIHEPDLISTLLSQFNIYIEGLTAIPINIPGTQYHRGMRAADMIRKELRALLRQRRDELENKVASPMQDILSYLLVTEDENGKLILEADIINEMLSLLFAGHNTLVSAITLIIKFLCEKRGVHEKVLQEQREIATSKARGELLTWEDLQKMKYSWHVVSEVLRVAPPVSGTFREALADITFEGYTIPKGWKLSWSAAYTHKDSSCHPNEMDFDESRFEGVGLRPFSYVPFGGGPRMCLGKEFARHEILVFLHNLVNQFDWDLLIPNEKLSYAPLLIAVNGLPIRLWPRELSN